MKKHVLWIKKRKLYISAFGACSYNDIDMLCDFMREKNASEGTHMTVNHGSRRKVVFFLGTFCAVFIMLLVWMDRQRDFHKNVTIKFLESVPFYFFHW